MRSLLKLTLTLPIIAACGPNIVDLDTEVLALDSQSTALILNLVNDSQTDHQILDIDAGLDRRAATNIIDYRAGSDGTQGTIDDEQFDTIAELDQVAYVGNSALRKLLDFALTRPQLSVAPAEGSEEPRQVSYNYSDRVINSVLTNFDLTDQNQLLVRAEVFDNGNRYLNRTELTEAAKDIVRDQIIISGFRFSSSVVDRVMSGSALRDRLALLTQAVRHNNDGNKYLKTSELEAAGDELAQPPTEIGIISDIDKTLLPPSGSLYTYLPPYPGAVVLLDELEHSQGRKSGNTFYVTTRNPYVIGEVPQWLTENGFPTGPVELGISPQATISQREKVSDISAILDANPNTTFVLFGDSNHRDPDAYGEIMSLYPGRIAAVFIHNVRNISATRTQGMNLYEDIHETAVMLGQLGILCESSVRRVLETAQAEGATLSDADIENMLAGNSP